LVVNGGFESGNFSGWSQHGDTSFTGVSMSAWGGTPNSGDYYAYFGPVTSEGGIFQSLTTVVGETYTIEFALAAEGDAPNSFSFDWGGSTLYSLENASTFNYQTLSFSQVATSASTDLRFNFYHEPWFWYLDDVSVVMAQPPHGTVPAPGALALFGLGLACLVGIRRRRRS